MSRLRPIRPSILRLIVAISVVLAAAAVSPPVAGANGEPHGEPTVVDCIGPDVTVTCGPNPLLYGPNVSSHCDAGPAVFDGFLGSRYVKLRAALVGNEAWVCAVLDDGTGHIGLKITAGGQVAVPSVDSAQGACSDPANADHLRFARSLTVGPTNEPVRLEVSTPPGEVWLCVLATSVPALARRVVLPVSDPELVEVVHDMSWPAYVPDPPSQPPRPSAACQNHLGPTTQLLNADVGSGHAAASYYREATSSGTRTHVCVRVDATSSVGAGGRLTYSTTGGQTFVTTGTDFGPCTTNVFTDAGPPATAIRISPAGLPASVCAAVGNLSMRVTVASGSQGYVVWTPDS